MDGDRWVPRATRPRSKIYEASPGRRPLLAALLVLVFGLVLVGPAGAAQPAGFRTAGPGAVGVPIDGQVRLTLVVPDDGRPPVGPESVVVTADGVDRPGRVQPLLSDQLALGLVVDGSEAGRDVVPGGLSGVANLLLTAADSTRSTLVVDRDPPTVAAPLEPGRIRTLAALSTVSGGGERSTAEAVELAVQQLPVSATEPRLLVLCTAAPDAGGPPAAELVARLNAAGVVLAVVHAVAAGQPPSDYWSTVAAGTGGPVLTTEPGQLVGAFDQLVVALRGRYLVTFPAPARLPATVGVRAATSTGPISTSAFVPAPTAAAPMAAVPMAAAPIASAPLVDLRLARPVVLSALMLAVVGIGLIARQRAVRPVARRGPAGRPAGGPPAPRPAAARGPVTRPPERRPFGPVWRLPSRPDPPIGRDRTLADLRDELIAGRWVVLRPAAGRPGAGTSTTMIEFAHRYRSEYDVVWWLPADLPELVPDRLAELAERLGLAVPADPVQRAVARLGAVLSDRGRWLLLVDEAVDPAQLTQLLPAGPGHVLVTSADPDRPEFGTAWTVPACTRTESVALLRARCPGLPVEAADRVADALGDLPLALDVAGATLTGTDLDADELVGRLGDGSAAGRPDAAWTVAVEALAADDPAALALLTLAAWLGPEPLPLALLSRDPTALPEPLAAAAGDPDELAERAAVLGRRGLARVTPHSVQLHRWAMGRLLAGSTGESPDGTCWPAVAVRLLAAGLPDGPPGADSDRPAWRQLLPLVLAATDPTRPLEPVAPEVGRLLDGAAGYLHAHGQPAAAQNLFEDAYDLCWHRHGPEHPDTAAAAARLAACLRDLDLPLPAPRA